MPGWYAITGLTLFQRCSINWVGDHRKPRRFAVYCRIVAVLHVATSDKCPSGQGHDWSTAHSRRFLLTHKIKETEYIFYRAVFGPVDAEKKAGKIPGFFRPNLGGY